MINLINNISGRQRVLLMISVVIAILLVPLIAMQFTSEVLWTASDFLIMGVLLSVTAFITELIIRLVRNSDYRFILIMGVFLIFLLIWAELAVGIFGTSFAGN